MISADVLADTPLRIVHVLLLVAWLGIDVGVFYASWRLLKPGRSAETRLELTHVLVALDRAPRISLVLMVPVALGLAHGSRLGLFGLSEGEANAIFWPLVVVAAIWIWAMLRHERAAAAGEHGTPFMRGYHWLNLLARLGIIAAFLLSGILSLTGDWEVWVDHVAVKSILFAAVVAAGQWIELSFRDFPGAFGDVVANGETPERLARLRRAVTAAYPPVLTLWALLVVLAIVGIAGGREGWF